MIMILFCIYYIVECVNRVCLLKSNRLNIKIENIRCKLHCVNNCVNKRYFEY